MSLYYNLCTLLVILFVALFSLSVTASATPTAAAQWRLLQSSIGISAMHMQLLFDDRVIIFDRTDFGPSNLSLPAGKCRRDSSDQALKTDCTAHSVEYDSLSNTFRPLNILTDPWCSSGATLADGRLLQTGGFNDGDCGVRTFSPNSSGSGDWSELPDRLLARRWYATDHVLPDGRAIIIGGRRQFNCEFYPKIPQASNFFNLHFLVETNDPKIENNLYPFVFLNADGNLFIFANNRAILLNYTSNKVIRTYPEIPGGDPRCYPSSGSAVMLPLRNLEDPKMEMEVLVCGGAPKGSYLLALNKSEFIPALNTCARIKITDPNANWTIETMPMSRVMSDMVLLPNGDVLIINGGGSGTAGWELGRDPVLAPVVYHPDAAPESRFDIQQEATIPRMYHSSAVLLRDGRVLVGGSNPHRLYNFTSVLFPTDLSLEAFSPTYLDPAHLRLRPVIIDQKTTINKVKHGDLFRIKFSINGKFFKPDSVKVNMIRPPFTTHSFSMSQRLLVLTNTVPKTRGRSVYETQAKAPVSANLSPPGFYMLFVVHKDVPSEGIWVQIQ